jgi:hypothetical protein
VVIYPKVGSWPDGAHHNLVFNFMGEFPRPEAMREDIDVLLDAIAAEARRSTRDVVVSSEILAGRTRLTEFVAALLAKLGSGFRAELLFVVRDHFERAASVYNQRVKDGAIRECRSPDAFLTQQASSLCFAPMLRGLLRTNIDLTVLNYHPASTFVSRFLEDLGFAEDQPVAPMRNVSLAMKALIATLAANRLCETSDERDAVSSALQRMKGSFAPSRFIFGVEAASLADGFFKKDRAFLRRRFDLPLPRRELTAMESGFAIDVDELDEIETALSGFGSKGHAIVDFSKQFLRRAGSPRSPRGLP